MRTVLDEAERKYYDEASIQHEIADLERQHREGLINDETFEEREDQLFELLMEARKYHQRQQEEGGT